jgi:hypothetical protein
LQKQRFKKAKNSFKQLLPQGRHFMDQQCKGEMEGAARLGFHSQDKLMKNTRLRLDKCSTPDDQPTVEAWNEAVKQRKIFIFEHRVKKRWSMAESSVQFTFKC